MKKYFTLLLILLFMSTTLVLYSAGSKEEGSFEMPDSFDWKNFSGSSITLMTLEHPLTDGIRDLLSQFEEETGIKVNVNAMAEDLYFDRMNVALRTEGNVDVYIMPMDGDSYI